MIDVSMATAIATECLKQATADDVEDLVRLRLGVTWPDLFPPNHCPRRERRPRQQLLIQVKLSAGESPKAETLQDFINEPAVVYPYQREGMRLSHLLIIKLSVELIFISALAINYYVKTGPPGYQGWSEVTPEELQGVGGRQRSGLASRGNAAFCGRCVCCKHKRFLAAA
ncbi:MAG: hypothetical protein WKF84_05430 [Pyrinomonadaceae bacterium]